jgi:hypothetical protein
MKERKYIQVGLCWNCAGSPIHFDDCGMWHCYECNGLHDLNDYNDSHPMFKVVKELYDEFGQEAVIELGEASWMPEAWCEDCDCFTYKFGDVCLVCWGSNILDPDEM